MPDAQTPDRKATVLLLLVIAGCVDAVGLAETGRYFVSYMSGNTTQLGLALAYQDWTAALVPLGLVALFVGGATAGTLLVEKAGRVAVPVLLFAQAALLLLAWALFGSLRPAAGIAPLPVAMGLANIVALRDGGARPGVTYATGTLVKLGVALAGLGRGTRAADVAFDCALWLALLVGSVAGAAGRLRYGSDVLLGVSAVVAVLAAVHLALALGRRRG